MTVEGEKERRRRETNPKFSLLLRCQTEPFLLLGRFTCLDTFPFAVGLLAGLLLIFGQLSILGSSRTRSLLRPTWKSCNVRRAILADRTPVIVSVFGNRAKSSHASDINDYLCQ